MIPMEFNRIVLDRIEKLKETLLKKQGEYAREDCLSNFKKAAGAMGISSEEALAGMVNKHFISVLDYCKDVTKGKQHTVPEWNEKLGDVIAYMVLLDAIVREKAEKEAEK
jgi:hypothetical protein